MTNAADWSSSHLGYRFADEKLLEQALTHRSAGQDNNERLEFLGDAVLGMVIARALYELKSEAREGALSRYRAKLVRRETLAQLARTLDLGQYLQMGSGEHRTGGHQRDSVLADALEALLGAILIDGGFPAVAEVVQNIFHDLLDSLPPEADLVDAKTALQERLQARGLPPPEYHLVQAKGAAHARIFSCCCRLADPQLEATGSGRSRRQAEQRAAALVMEQLGDDG